MEDINEGTTSDTRYMRMLHDLVLREVPKDYAVFLFGSRARKELKKHADADIGILGNKPIPREVILRIQALIEASVIPYKVDLLDFYTVDPSFKEIAKQDIEIWYCPKTITLV